MGKELISRLAHVLNFCNLIFLQPDDLDLQYFKLWILIDPEDIVKDKDTGLEHYNLQWEIHLFSLKFRNLNLFPVNKVEFFHLSGLGSRLTSDQRLLDDGTEQNPDSRIDLLTYTQISYFFLNMVSENIKSMKTTFYLSFDCQQAFWELKV